MNMMLQPKPPPPPDPIVGMGATMQVGSDQYAVTIIGVTPSGKTIKLQHDRVRLTKESRRGLSKDRGAHQQHLFTSDPNGEVVTARL